MPRSSAPALEIPSGQRAVTVKTRLSTALRLSDRAVADSRFTLHVRGAIGGLTADGDQSLRLEGRQHDALATTIPNTVVVNGESYVALMAPLWHSVREHRSQTRQRELQHQSTPLTSSVPASSGTLCCERAAFTSTDCVSVVVIVCCTVVGKRR